MPGIYMKYFPIGDRPKNFMTRVQGRDVFTKELITDLATYANCPGLTIMREVSKRNLTFQTLTDQLQVYFHNGHFTWDPNYPEGGANWAPILDGSRISGECNCLALALLKLAELPQPFGLGLVGVQHARYRGALHGQGIGSGFVSQHPAGGILGLLPNVLVNVGVNLALLGVAGGNGVYLWLNHKVVENGHFYDPCYRQIWNPIEQMALGRRIGHTRRTAGVIPASFQETDTYYDVVDINGVNYYFRQLSGGERVNGAAYEMLALAPIGAAIGDSTM